MFIGVDTKGQEECVYFIFVRNRSCDLFYYSEVNTLLFSVKIRYENILTTSFLKALDCVLSIFLPRNIKKEIGMIPTLA